MRAARCHLERRMFPGTSHSCALLGFFQLGMNHEGRKMRHRVYNAFAKLIFVCFCFCVEWSAASGFYGLHSKPCVTGDRGSCVKPTSGFGSHRLDEELDDEGKGKRMENMTQTMAGTQTLSWPLLVTVWSVSCATHRPSDREAAHLGPCHQMPGSKSYLSHWSAVYLETSCRILCIFTALWSRSEIVQIGRGNSIGISHGKHLVYGHNKRLLIKSMSEWLSEWLDDILTDFIF